MRHRTRNVAVVLDTTQNYDQKIIGGIIAYVQEKGDWSLYVEEKIPQRLFDRHAQHWDGIIATFDDSCVATTVTQAKIPVVGVSGKYGWYDRTSGIPYVAFDDQAITRLAAEHSWNGALPISPFAAWHELASTAGPRIGPGFSINGFGRRASDVPAIKACIRPSATGNGRSRTWQDGSAVCPNP